MENRKNIIRKLVFRFVKKRIAGSTSGSALNMVKELNTKGLHTTVTLLNDHVDDQIKARYNSNAYSQFIRQLSRLNLNSAVSVRLSQIGYHVDSSVLEKNLMGIIDVANSCNQRLWIENEADMENEEVMRIYRQYKPRCKSLGAELRPDSATSDNMTQLRRVVSSNDIIKLTPPLDKKGKARADKTDRLKLYDACINALVNKRVGLTIFEDDPKLINRIVTSNKDHKRNLIFEVPLGYSSRKLNALQKGKLNLSVYVPYGKDWIPYLINRLAEGRVRDIAVTLLNGEKSGVDLNAKNEEDAS